jgi:hypothetical protein
VQLLIESGIFPETKLSALKKAINEILAMTVASIKTLRSKQSGKIIQNPKSKI